MIEHTKGILDKLEIDYIHERISRDSYKETKRYYTTVYFILIEQTYNRKDN